MASSQNIVIDARPILDGILAADLIVNGSTILERHIRLAQTLKAAQIYIVVDPKKTPKALHLHPSAVLLHELPSTRSLILDARHVYKEKSLRLVWKLRNSKDLPHAEAEIIRSEFFTISKHTLRPLGKKIAELAYLYTPLTGNHFTILRIAVGLLGSYFFWRGSPLDYVWAGVCVLSSWLFDLTDGQVARLRNEVSKFGAYLDAVGDGVVDNLYYISIVLGAYRWTGNSNYLFLLIIFLFGKYVFVNSTLLAPVAHTSNRSTGGANAHGSGSSLRRAVKRVFALLDDTDVRIHFLAIISLCQRPLYALYFHLVYFNLRWVLNLINAYYKFEVKKEDA